MSAFERRALLYLARHLRDLDAPWRHRLWWTAIELLPDAQDMPASLYHWAPIAESLALSNPVRKARP